MYSNVILTSGKSILGKGNYFGKCINENSERSIDSVRGLKKWALEVWNKCYNQNKISEDPLHISVEYSLIYRLKESDNLIENPYVSLIHTNTKEGIASAELCKLVIEKEFNAKVTLKGFDLHVDNRKQINKELGNFMDILVTELGKGNPAGTFFSPTPGYKLMSYFAYVAGSFYGYEMGYLYEEKPIFQRVPPIPIEFDIGDISKFINLIRSISNEEVCYEDLDYSQKQFIDTHSYFFDILDDIVYLNAFGDFILSDFLGVRILVSEDVYKLLKNKDSILFINKEIFKLIKKIGQYYKSNFKSYEGELKHNLSWREQGLPYLYKSLSKDSIFRAIWDYDFNSKELKLYYIWLDHRKYENEYINRFENIKKAIESHKINLKLYEI